VTGPGVADTGEDGVDRLLVSDRLGTTRSGAAEDTRVTVPPPWSSLTQRAAVPSPSNTTAATSTEVVLTLFPERRCRAGSASGTSFTPSRADSSLPGGENSAEDATEYGTEYRSEYGDRHADRPTTA
jgi:hypothetical protein